MLAFDLFYGKIQFASPCFCMALTYWYRKMLRIHILDISSIIQLNWILMMSIRAPSRHKIGKWADRKSKMAATAAILKIDFRHLFPNFWSLWAKTCCVETGSKQAKLLLIRIPRWLHWFHSTEQDGRQSYIDTLQTTSRPLPMPRSPK